MFTYVNCFWDDWMLLTCLTTNWPVHSFCRHPFLAILIVCDHLCFANNERLSFYCNLRLLIFIKSIKIFSWPKILFSLDWQTYTTLNSIIEAFDHIYHQLITKSNQTVNELVFLVNSYKSKDLVWMILDQQNTYYKENHFSLYQKSF